MSVWREHGFEPPFRLVEPKFDECQTCIFFSRRHVNPNCGLCTVGEYYEERVSERALPSDRELGMIFAGMREGDDE